MDSESKFLRKLSKHSSVRGHGDLAFTVEFWTYNPRTQRGPRDRTLYVAVDGFTVHASRKRAARKSERLWVYRGQLPPGARIDFDSKGDGVLHTRNMLVLKKDY